MIDFATRWTAALPAWLGLLLFCGLAVLMAFAPYYLLRRLFNARLSEDAQSMSSSIIVRLGALHALILALVFAQEQINYTEVRHSNVQEAAATADAYYELRRYGDIADAWDVVEPLEDELARYVSVVIVEEWALLRGGTLSSKAWAHYDSIESGLLGLGPESEVERFIWHAVLEDWDEVSEYRRAREMGANYRVPSFFWVVAVFGFILLAASYFPFEPSPANLWVLAACAVFNGVVLYFIISIANPFAGPAPLEPAAFQQLFSEDMVNRIKESG